MGKEIKFYQKDFVRTEKKPGFFEKLIAILREKYSGAYEFDYRTVIKTNDCKKPAVVIYEIGNHVGKTLYLEDVVKKFDCKDDVIEKVAEEIMKVYSVRTKFEKIDGSSLFDKMKDFNYLGDGHIILKLINREKSAEYLRGKTWLPYLDLAITFYMTIDNSIEDGIGTVAIPVEASKFWGITLEEALEEVLLVMERDYPIKRINLSDPYTMLREYSGQCHESETDDTYLSAPRGSMIVQTNTYKIDGSSTILYKNNLADFCDKWGVNEVFILPSSLHEVILIPRDGNLTIDGGSLQTMIRDVNATQVASDEVLSDNLYLYNRDSNSITIWND